MSGLEPPPPGVVITDPKVLAERRDAYLRDFATKVAGGQHMIQAVFGDRPGDAFAYTVGLHSLYGCPELWVGTLGPEQAADLLNGMAHLIAAHGWPAVAEGGLLEFELEPSVREWFSQFSLRGPAKVAELEVGIALDVAAIVARTTAPGLEVWQVCWPDTEGRFPDMEGYDQTTWPQRLLPLEGT